MLLKFRMYCDGAPKHVLIDPDRVTFVMEADAEESPGDDTAVALIQLGEGGGRFIVMDKERDAVARIEEATSSHLASDAESPPLGLDQWTPDDDD